MGTFLVSLNNWSRSLLMSFWPIISSSSEESAVVAGELGEGPRVAPGQDVYCVGDLFMGTLTEDPEQRNDLLRGELRHPGPDECLPRHLVGHGDELDVPTRHGG